MTPIPPPAAAALSATGRRAEQAARQGRAIAAALRNERLAPAAVRAMQDRKLRAIVRHAWSASPFYRRKFRAAGITPDDIRSVDDLVKLPPTTKAEVQAAGPTGALAVGPWAGDTVVEPTSGSSGKVLHVHHTPEAYDTSPSATSGTSATAPGTASPTPPSTPSRPSPGSPSASGGGRRSTSRPATPGATSRPSCASSPT